MKFWKHFHKEQRTTTTNKSHLMNSRQQWTKPLLDFNNKWQARTFNKQRTLSESSLNLFKRDLNQGSFLILLSCQNSLRFFMNILERNVHLKIIIRWGWSFCWRSLPTAHWFCSNRWKLRKRMRSTLWSKKYRNCQTRW